MHARADSIMLVDATNLTDETLKYKLLRTAYPDLKVVARTGWELKSPWEGRVRRAGAHARGTSKQAPFSPF